MGLTNEDVERILRIVDESGYDEIRLEHGDLKLHVRRHGAEGQPAVVATSGGDVLQVSSLDTSSQPLARAEGAFAAERAAAVPEEALPEGLVAVRAPMLGTFYRCPSPGAPPFVEEGRSVRVDDTVCLLEVMKLFNTLKAGVDGRVVRFLVENGTMVEYDQPLLLIDPDGKG